MSQNENGFASCLRCEGLAYHNGDIGLLPVGGGESGVREGGERGERGHRGGVPRVERRLHEGHGAHRPVAAQVAREQEQPQVDGHQVHIRQLPRRRRGHGSRVIEPVNTNFYLEKTLH